MKLSLSVVKDQDKLMLRCFGYGQLCWPELVWEIVRGYMFLTWWAETTRSVSADEFG